MKNEIKVGEYVRLENGDIFKIDEDTTNYYNSNKDFITNEIVKHSSNLIDIIEERRLCKWNIGNKKRKYAFMGRNKRNRWNCLSYTN